MSRTKEFGVDSMGIQKTMTFGDYFGDGIGQVPLNAMSCLIGQLTYFYTEKVGLAAASVATMLIIAKVIDAFTDLMMGKVMDSVHFKGGKARPWFKIMTLPVAFVIVLLFIVPKNAPAGFQTGYVLISNLLASAIVYTAIAIPYGALMALRTNSVEERGKMGIVRAIFGYVIGMVITILLIPITNALGGDQAAWIKVAVVLAVISAISMVILYRTSKENRTDQEKTAEEAEEGKMTFFQEIGILFKNKYWVIMLFAGLFMNISFGLSTSGSTYYAKYILGNDNIVALLGGVGLIPSFLGFALVGPMTKKFGMAKTCVIGCLIGIAGCIYRVFTPYSLVSCLIGGCMATFANIPIMCLIGAMVNNCVEYNDWKFGKRLIGMSNSASSFGSKIGSGIGGSLIGWILGACGFISGAAASKQPAAVNVGIFAFSIYVPLILLIILAILFKFYDLEKIYPKIMSDLNARKNGKAAEED
ncbi:MAG: glycoside-pentoside-hexuronide (GPH):cation symporter [Lachnospiraceae bacterium]|nr:glycoside-pentoside-hexuronide (GPH):cation symporter [Lachnospiraceae bacterium]